MRTFAWIAGILVLAGGAGFLTATAAFSQAPEPTRTVTVDVATGPTGPEGPAGPTGPVGPAGGQSCPTKYSPGILVINAPGGQVKIYTCLAD